MQTAEALVRPARPGDALAIAVLQGRAWRGAYASVLPATLVDALGADPTALLPSWEATIDAPPSPEHRVLVATADGVVVAVVTSAPTDDPDLEGAVEVASLTVDPSRTGEGHGSRLLAAAIDLARGDVAGSDAPRDVVSWVAADDEPLRRFLVAAGFVPDGAHRELEGPDGARLREVRLRAGL